MANLLPDVADDMIISKIEKAHRAPQKDPNQYSTPGPLPIIAKFIDWNFSEKAKSNFIKAARDSFQQDPNQRIYLIACSYHVTYPLQSEPTLLAKWLSVRL